MSRKTRKLIWSAPLVAVLAVAGALAIFAALAPNEATAHEAAEHGPPGPVTGLMAAPVSGMDADGQPAGRTQIMVSWMAPGTDMSGPADSYRIDYSDNTRIWKNLVGGESGEAALMDAMADENCAADAAEGMRCFTDTSLMPGQLRHYRVFAMNDYGTSPVSIEPTYVTETTVDYARPSAARMLTATTGLVDSIVLDWQPPTDMGGATLLFYCLAVGNDTTDIPDLTVEAQAPNCLNEDAATAATAVPRHADDGTFTPGAIVVDADTTTFTHDGLDDPDTVSLYYRVYAVTDRDGDPDTTNAVPTAVTNERYISLAASNVANGRTISPLPDVNTDVEVTPDSVTNLRYVLTRNAEDDINLNLYWTLPANYPGAPETGDPDLRTRWRIEVERWDPNATDGPAFVDVAVAGTVTQPAQWAGDDPQVDTLEDAEQLFQVRYVNNVDGTADTPDDNDDTNDNDVYGAVYRFRVPQATEARNAANNLPTIADAVYTAGSEAGLRFKHNELNPTTWLDLVWTRDASAGNSHTPSGYVIDYTEATGTTDANTRWISLPNARRPSDLGATTQYTHKGVTPGKQYQYRVFPEHGSHNVGTYGYRYGLPQTEEASSKHAPLPDPVQGLKVVANPDDPQTELVLTWSMLPDDPDGHPVLGYRVEVANDRDNNMTLNTEATGFDWFDLAIRADAAATPPVVARAWSVDKDTLTYTYDGSGHLVDTNDETLAGGHVRWFRVIAITAENDGDQATGGQAVTPSDGDVERTPTTETSPNAATQASAQPAKGMTDAPEAPDDPSQVTSPPMPEDLTSEEASDTNLLNPTDRGVLLLWNEPGEDAEGINAYIVQRKIGTGDWTPIARVTDRTSFSDSREYVDGEDLQYRVGSLGASSVPASYTAAVMYPTHAAMHVPGMPMNVMATAGYASASDWWETLDCAGMVAAVPADAVGNTGMANMDNPYCAHYPGSAAVMGGAGELAAAQKDVVDATFAMRYPDMGVASVITVMWDAPLDGGSAITDYTVQSKYGDMDFMDATVKSLAMDDTTVVHTGLMANTTYYYQVAAENAEGMGPYSDGMAMAMTGNRAPMAEGSIDAVTVVAGQMSDAMDVSMYFSDADGDTLTYTASSDMEMYATADIPAGSSMLTITGVAAGSATVTVTAADGNGGMAMQPIMVTVASANSDPMTVGSIDAVMLRAGEMSDPITLNGYFSDADGDMLMYSQSSSDDMIATAMITKDDTDPGAPVYMLTITGHMAGDATITVTASDGMGGMDAEQEIMVTVRRGMLTAPMDVMASHTGLQVTVTWEGGMNADTFAVAMIRQDAEGNWDIPNAVYDTGVTGSPHEVNMATRPAGTYHVFVIAGSTDDGWSNWIAGSLNYAP